MTFTLLTNAYAEQEPRRAAEYQACLEHNLANPLFDRVIVVYESAGTLQREHPKLTVETLGKRGTFGEYFDIANQLPPGTRAVLSNADIFFDETLALLDHDLSKAFVCLSRWDDLPDGSARIVVPPDSHDAWIFQTPLVLPECDFTLGVPGCDGRIAWLAQRARLTLSNPSKSVRAHHLHQSGIRHYHEGHRLRGAYQAVWPTELPIRQ